LLAKSVGNWPIIVKKIRSYAGISHGLLKEVIHVRNKVE
jgi:hypothetical protein